jgi:hypothetical protein
MGILEKGNLQTSNFQLPRVVRSNFQYYIPWGFDASSNPNSSMDREAANQRGLVYDSGERVYRDEDGCPVRDEFGQPLG